MDATTFNTIVNTLKTSISLSVGTIYGPMAKGFFDVALGHPAFLTQLAAMGEKNERGQLTGDDYASLIKIAGDIGVGMALAGGATISLPVAALWGLTGVGLAIWNNRGTIEDVAGKIDDILKNGAGVPVGSGDPFTGMPWPGIDNQVNGAMTSALNWVPPRRDPLVLDLDGGGIATSGINPNAPILFDQNGDGTLTATGWIGPGEAIVVRDLNGNGTIDSGRELFGDNTILTCGPKAGQTATNGFEALADLDMDANGVADGKFDSNDVAYASVKLWKDLSQDGVSQADELFSFEQLGVTSINVSGTASNINLGGGNTQTFSGSFTCADGTVGASGTAQLAGSLLLVNNNFYREFTDWAAAGSVDTDLS